MLELDHYDWQTLVWQNMTRFTVMVAGRQIGKTELLIDRAVTKLMDSQVRRPRAWLTTRRYKQAHENLWVRAVEKLERARLLQSKNETNLELRLPGGRILFLKGIDDKDSLVGETLVFAGMDEAALHDAAAWQGTIRPMLAVHNGEAVFSTTPRGRNWIYELFQLGLDPKRPEWSCFHLNAEEAGIISEAELAEMRDTMSPEEYAQEIRAEFLNYTGLFCPEFESRFHPRGNILPWDAWVNYPKADCIFICSMDWGLAHNTVVHWICIDPVGRMLVFDEYVAQGKNLHQLEADIKAKVARHPTKPKYMVVDRSMFNRRAEDFTVTTLAAQLGARLKGCIPYMKSSDSNFDFSRERLRSMCVPEVIPDDPPSAAAPMPRFMIVEGKAPKLVGELKKTDIRYADRKGHLVLGAQEVDAIDSIRYAVMETVRGQRMGEEEDQGWDAQVRKTMRIKRAGSGPRYHPVSGLPMGGANG